MSAAAGRFPTSWLFLEPYVFQRDDDESFPDESEAPIRASGTTSWGAPFRVAFSVAVPPRISRIYALLPEPGFPPRKWSAPIAIMANPHRHLALLIATTSMPSEGVVQSFSIFRANQSNPSESSLQTLPPCTEPKFDYYHGDIRRRRPSNGGTPRLLVIRSLGFWCGDQEEFVVAELTTYGHANKAFAEMCMLRGHCTTTTTSALHQHQVGGRWKSVRVEILPAADVGLCGWQTDAAIGFQRWLFPLDTSTTTCNIWYGGASVVGHGRGLKFVNVARHDGISYGPLIPGTGFTITCHTLVLLGVGGMAWKEDYAVTSDELWDANPPDRLPRGIPMFPRVDVDRPHVLHFICIEFTNHNTHMGVKEELPCGSRKIWVVSIDMTTKTVESSYLYIDWNEHPQTDDPDFIIKKCASSPVPFIPCEFPRFCYLSRYVILLLPFLSIVTQ
ncbi:unnamed protein product [Urochloa decumbens]|uniref:DUF1618 domain-containing protein n=1 Tax=Urochloa decumbens TaxID=240449 RepID=A0ABC8VGQ2_9POAL